MWMSCGLLHVSKKEICRFDGAFSTGGCTGAWDGDLKCPNTWKYNEIWNPLTDFPWWAWCGRILPTIGFNIGRIQIDKVIAVFWDLGGHASFRSVWHNYYPEVQGTHLWESDTSWQPGEVLGITFHHDAVAAFSLLRFGKMFTGTSQTIACSCCKLHKQVVEPGSMCQAWCHR